YSYAYNLNTNMDFNETVTVEFEAWENDTLQCTYESDRDDDYFLGYPTWTNSSGSDGFTSFTGGGTYLPSRWRFNHNTNNLDNWLFPFPSTWNFKYATAWRYTNGEAESPLDYGTVPANNFRTHVNSNISIIDDTHPWSNDLLSYPFAEVWYSFTITEEMPVVISTVNNTTNYDTALALYENSIAPENFVIWNQNQFPDVLQAEISTTLPAGYYIIRVTEEEFPRVSGKFELTITTGNPIVSVEENDLSNELSVFPNPAQEVVTIGLGESFKSARIDLVNTLGQVVYSTTIVDEKSIQFTVDQFDSGIYTLVVSDKNNVAKKQLVLN
ncbi:MAG: T9SS type A sorting domain-containing protein, partial [Flavobacteriales bacterium]